MSAARCPACGHLVHGGDPYRLVVLGQDEGRAPVLSRAWGCVVASLRDADELPASGLAERVAAAAGCSPVSVGHLLRAGSRAGLVRRRYAWAGTPRRRRAYVRLAGEARR